MTSTSYLNQKTAIVKENLFNAIVKKEADQYITLYHTIGYYQGGVDTITIRIGYYEHEIKPNRSFFFCIDPDSVNYKHLFVYYDNVAYEFEDFDDYFVGQPQSVTDTMTPEIQQYINTQIAAAISNAQSADSVAPVQNLTGLHNVTTLTDQRVIYIEDVNALYAYDAQSTEAVDGTTIINSHTGVGRWIMVNKNIDGGTL